MFFVHARQFWSSRWQYSFPTKERGLGWEKPGQFWRKKSSLTLSLNFCQLLSKNSEFGGFSLLSRLGTSAKKTWWKGHPSSHSYPITSRETRPTCTHSTFPRLALAALIRSQGFSKLSNCEPPLLFVFCYKSRTGESWLPVICTYFNLHH